LPRQLCRAVACRRPVADPGGPHLTAALICERVLQEQDGVLSAIRIIDRILFRADEHGTPLDPQHPFTLLLSLKAGSARGRFTVRVVMEKPSGEQVPVLQSPVHFESEDRGVNLVVQTLLEADQEGVYWFDVLFEEERLTRIPLRAAYQPRPVAGG
jgi:hypothetical protein